MRNFCCQVDILGRSLFHLLHPDDHQFLRSQLELSSSDLLIDDVEDRGGQCLPLNLGSVGTLT